MELTKKQQAFKFFCYALIILIAHLIQNIDGLFPQILGARCFLLLPVSIILCLGEDEKNGALLWLFAGFLWDITSGVHMGFNCIFIMIVCFFSCAFITYIARDIFITNLICCGITIASYCFLYWLFFIVIKGIDGAEETLFNFYIPCAIYTLLMTPVIWLVLNPIKRKLKKT